MQDHIGFGALNEALGVLEGGGYASVLVVASESAWKRFNGENGREFFRKRNTRLFSDFSVNPDFKEILAGVEVCKAFKPDLILAIGGGSPIDVAKMIKAVVFTKKPYDPMQPETMEPSGEGPPLIAVATTAGSGSESTQYAVFYLGEKKQSLGHDSLRPDMAVVDPDMSYSLSPQQTAATGLDALSQSVEAYWSARTCPEARDFAEASIRYILPNLQKAVRHPDPASRYHMAQGAYLSGKAIQFTRTTLPHALCYHLTKRYGLPHGHAVALTLPYFFILNLDQSLPVQSPLGADGHYENMHRLIRLMGQTSAETAFAFWRDLLGNCGLANTFPAVGVDDAAKMRALVDSVDYAKAGNHPVKVDAEVLFKAFSAR